ncbi:MAG TPA: tetratricopeptide repeat protein [Chryseosolibacter sp.]
MSKYLLIIISCYAFITVSGQTLPDSLRKHFEGMTRDSIYVDRLNAVAQDYLKTNPNTTRAIVAHALDVAPKIKYTRGYARALTVMGNSYWYEGIYEFAQNYYLLAARQYQAIRDSVGLGHTFNNIGEVYKKLGENEKALPYLLKSQDLSNKDSVNYPLTLYNIGELYLRIGKKEEARTYILKSFEAAKQRNLLRVMAFDYWGMGALNRLDGNYGAALNDYLKAEELWKSLGEVRSLVQTNQEISDIFKLQKKFHEAETRLLAALKMTGEIKVADLQVSTYQRLSSLYALQGNHERALYYLTRHNSLKDSVYNLLKAEQIARLQTIYETDAREKENQQLRSEGELRNSELRTQRITSIAIGVGLLLTGTFAWFLYQQRRRIAFQRDAIEMQAVALLKLNEELQQLNKNLEERISERTSQLTIQNQRLTEYTFINAHKLRAPVASILGLINLVHQVPPDEREAILNHLKTCGDQLDSIIREVSRNLEAAIVNEK